MTKKEIEFIIKNNSYLEKGTKQACIKVRDYLKKIEVIESKSSIDLDEFCNCINTLLAACFQDKDKIPSKFYCENDCKYSGFLLCAGEFNIDQDSDKICPYYTPER